MNELLSQLGTQDEETIKDFLYTYVDSEVPHLEDVLSEWSKNKQTLWLALGKKLRVRIPVELKVDARTRRNLLAKIYTPQPSIFCQDALDSAEQCEKKKQTFINNFYLYFYNLYIEEQISALDFKVINLMTSYKNICSGYISRLENLRGDEKAEYIFHYKNKTLQLKNGAKTVKALQKVLKFFDYPRMDLFEQFRNQLSDITTKTSVKSDIVFSIHPLDFLTMSDNNCDWSSCMTIVHNGAHCEGVVEMLNSPMVLLAYLESSTLYTFHGHIIPNKSWRTLVYLDRDIMLVGNHYPFTNLAMSDTILAKLNALVEENLGWRYKLKNQTYTDLRGFSNQEELSKRMFTQSPSQSIVIYTEQMYNDLVAYKENDYKCYRNPVPETTYLCASGEQTCLHCGRKMRAGSKYRPSVRQTLVCPECNANLFCEGCGKIHPRGTDMYSLKDAAGHTVRFCKDSESEYWYDTNHSFVIKKSDMTEFKNLYMIPVAVYKNEQELKETAKVVGELFEPQDEMFATPQNLFLDFSLAEKIPNVRYVVERPRSIEDSEFNSFKRYYINDNFYFYAYTQEDFMKQKLNLVEKFR